MPNLPFNPPVTDEELWANILHDLGAVPYSTQQNITMHDILLRLNYGVYQTGLDTYGNGNDGVCTFISAGSTTVAGATLSSGTYTMTRDIWLASGSTINASVIIATAGFRIFCQGELINNGTIQSNGNAASANTAGAALAYTGTLSATTVGTAGGAGVTATTGNNGTNTTVSLGGVGGAGGLEGGGSGTAGVGGTVGAPAATVQLPYSMPLAITGKGLAATAFQVLTAGTGGGAGAGDGTNLSGGGGGGGGIVVVCAQRLGGTGTISANGGAGGAANATGNSGGGGGGGGGIVIVVSRAVQPVAVNSSGPLISGQTITAAGGAGGAGNGTGAAGNSVTAAAAGTVILLPG